MMNSPATRPSTQPQRFKWLAFSLLLFVILVALVYWAFPQNTSCAVQQGPFNLGIDYRCAFRPAVVALFQGRSPYTGVFFNPPWALLILAPLALLPPGWGAATMAVLVLAGFAVAAARLGLNRAARVVFLLNPLVLTVARQGNLDWLVALGTTLPPQFGLFLVVIKPQASLGIIIFWLIEALRQGGIRQAVRTFAPVTLAYLLSFALFGLWTIPPRWVIASALNYSLWPLGIPIGLALLASALRSRDIRRAITASPFLSPYVLTMTWSVAFVGLNSWELIVAVLATIALHMLIPGLGLYPIKLVP